MGSWSWQNIQVHSAHAWQFDTWIIFAFANWLLPTAFRSIPVFYSKQIFAATAISRMLQKSAVARSLWHDKQKGTKNTMNVHFVPSVQEERCPPANKTSIISKGLNKPSGSMLPPNKISCPINVKRILNRPEVNAHEASPITLLQLWGSWQALMRY